MWFLPRVPVISAIRFTAIILAACATPRTLATFQTQDGTISLQQSIDGSTYSLVIGRRTSLPLDGYTSAHIDSIWNMPRDRLIVVTGAGKDCGLRYTLVIAQSDTGSLHAIGECGDTYVFTQDGAAVTIRQIGVRNPSIWTFRDGVLNGPTTAIAARPSRSSPSATSSRAAEGANADATSPPAVSAPVGDEVIPPPVGGSGPSRPEQ
jgi:hypothetical protein